MDEPDNQYGTKMARLLAHAKEHGLETSVDVVSEMSDRFQKIVPPSLKYTDYCIINEIEAQCTTGISLRENGELQRQNMKKALEKMNEMGVAKWAVIHCPECGFGLDCRTGEYVEVPSLKLPKGFIKNTTGAGDAYCAGVLYGAHEDRSLEDSMTVSYTHLDVYKRQPQQHDQSRRHRRRGTNPSHRFFLVFLFSLFPFHFIAQGE